MFPEKDNDELTGGMDAAPPADAMFESFLGDGLDDLDAPKADEVRGSDVLDAGLHFFERMKGE